MAAAIKARYAARKEGKVVSYKLAAGVTIFGQTLVFLRADGYAYPARSGTPGDVFVGVAQGTAINTNGAAGDVSVLVDKEGAYVMNKAAAVQADLASPMYAADDQTLTATALNNVLVGYPTELVSGTEIRIRIDGAVH